LAMGRRLALLSSYRPRSPATRNRNSGHCARSRLSDLPVSRSTPSAAACLLGVGLSLLGQRHVALHRRGFDYRHAAGGDGRDVLPLTTPGARSKLGASTITRVDLTLRWATFHPASLLNRSQGTAAHEPGITHSQTGVVIGGPSTPLPAPTEPLRFSRGESSGDLPEDGNSSISNGRSSTLWPSDVDLFPIPASEPQSSS